MKNNTQKNVLINSFNCTKKDVSKNALCSIGLSKMRDPLKILNRIEIDYELWKHIAELNRLQIKLPENNKTF